MTRLGLKMFMILLLVACVAAGQETVPSTAQANPRQRQRRIPTSQPQIDNPYYPDPPPAEGSVEPNSQPLAPAASPAAQPPPAAPQPPADQLPPPTTPQVAYRNGQLTVRALNSTLESVLTAIRNKAGIQFEGLEGGAPERVVISMGPAPEGEVLAAILGGSRFDYVAVDRPDSPGIVQRVVLSLRKAAGTAEPSRTQLPPPSMRSGEEEENTEEVAEPESPQDMPARPPLMQAQPQIQINPQPNQPQPNQQPTGPKTPEQLLEELKQMQQRQQQQQQPPPQQQPPGHQPPP